MAISDRVDPSMIMAGAFDEVGEVNRDLVRRLVLGAGTSGEVAGVEVLAELLLGVKRRHGDVRHHHDAEFADENRAGGR